MIRTVRDLLRSQGYDALQLVERVASGERQVLALLKSGSKVYLADHVKQYVDRDFADVTIPDLVSEVEDWLQNLKAPAQEIESAVASFKARFGLAAPVSAAPPAPPVAPPAAPKK